MKKRSALLMVAVLCCQVACVTTKGLLPADARMIVQVPYFEQEDFQCGPAALATVINYWHIKDEKSDKRITVDSIIAEIYSPSAKGVLGLDLEFYARKLGFNVVQYSGTLEEIKRSIDAKSPIIILVDYGATFLQQNHFMVAKGYTHDSIVFNSGRRENQLISNEALMRIWKKTGFWALTVKPSA
jgi:predicted double-glycine peptidase